MSMALGIPKNQYWNQTITLRFFIHESQNAAQISNFSYTLNHMTHTPLFS